ncbi:dihydrodipicolinate reductase [Natrialba sp. SSL1]|uniref:NAD(P)H-dependent amine dehydrogenase family protein n=1 Tax=Natrialba sp. SSL1 TaxID=1869245 RepID=UPI0011140725|nr:dihydrodipicolinate reductase [Natrialba sp. SSL1]
MDSKNKLTAVQYGVGPIGQRIVRNAVSKGIHFIGGVDIDPSKVGERLDDICETKIDGEAKITDDASSLLPTSPDVVFHSTVSSVEKAESQLLEALEAGSNVITTCEELSHPWQTHPGPAERIDKVARENGVACVATGINPGFVMDVLPALLSTPFGHLKSVSVTRIQNASQRRIPLQQKVGAGLSPESFEEKVADGAGHVGSRESLEMVADGLGWSLVDVTSTIEPVIAEAPVENAYTEVDTGNVAGVRQIIKGTTANGKEISLDLQMYAGANRPRDEIKLNGNQEIVVTVNNGYHGDHSTAAVVTNIVREILRADSGLNTMLDITLPAYQEVY